ncbi:hypothetical protein HDE_08265 [Halotydeus destructor]|nr:hypothetical protein HDE_08265 [Halotydeus destructor]
MKTLFSLVAVLLVHQRVTSGQEFRPPNPYFGHSGLFPGHSPDHFQGPQYPQIPFPVPRFPHPAQPQIHPYATQLPPSPAACVPAEPKLDYGQCPTLEAKEEDKAKKEEKQKECLKDLELSENSTLSELSNPVQDKMKECALRKDKLVNDAGKYNYDQALEKLKEKSLPETVQKKAEEAHIECKIQSRAKYLLQNAILSEVSEYQSCMDFHLAMFCDIKIKPQAPPSTEHFHGISQPPGQYHDSFQHFPNFGDTMNRLKVLEKFLR